MRRHACASEWHCHGCWEYGTAERAREGRAHSEREAWGRGNWSIGCWDLRLLGSRSITSNEACRFERQRLASDMRVSGESFHRSCVRSVYTRTLVNAAFSKASTISYLIIIIFSIEYSSCARVLFLPFTCTPALRMTKRVPHLGSTPERVCNHFPDAYASSVKVVPVPTPTPPASSPSPPSDTNGLTFDTQDSDLARMADAASALHVGCLQGINEGNSPENPVLQAVQIKPMASQNNQERYRVVMSDSRYFIQCMLSQRKYALVPNDVAVADRSSECNYLMHEGKLKKGVICRLGDYQVNFVKDKNVLIILDLEVLEEYGEPEKIGAPEALAVPPEQQQADVKQQPGNISGNGMYGNKPPQQPQQKALPSRTNAVSNGGSHGNIHPIEALSPYAHRWTIKARCTHKGDIKTWHNKNGEGKLFSVNFLDESGEIRATGFNDAVDQWYDVLQEGNVYYVSSPCKVQLAKKQFSNVNNDYELTFERDTQIEKAEDMDGVPQVRFSFTPLADLPNVAKDQTIDCIGILQNVDEVSEIVSKTTNKPFNKRELTIVDSTGYSVRLTVWGKTAVDFDVQPESVVAFKGAKVSDFNGRSLSLLASGTMKVDPDMEEAYKLKGWYDGSGRNEQFQTHANAMSTTVATGGKPTSYKLIQQIRDENLGMGEDTDWFSVKATVIYIKQDTFAYPACLSPDCNKKVVETEPGQWRCEKCDKTHDRPDYRYIMSVNVSDHTGQIWLSCFNEVGEQIMGMSANELMVLKDEGDDRRVTDAFAEANCKTLIFRCKAKMDTFNETQRYVESRDYLLRSC